MYASALPCSSQIPLLLLSFYLTYHRSRSYDIFGGNFTLPPGIVDYTQANYEWMVKMVKLNPTNPYEFTRLDRIPFETPKTRTHLHCANTHLPKHTPIHATHSSSRCVS